MNEVYEAKMNELNRQVLGNMKLVEVAKRKLAEKVIKNYEASPDVEVKYNVEINEAIQFVYQMEGRLQSSIDARNKLDEDMEVLKTIPYNRFG